MSKGLIVFIVALAVGLGASAVIYMKKSADDAQKRSGEILNDFRKVDKSLQESNASLDSLNILLTDSLRNKYQ